jgi:hypothetical protein
MIFARWIWLSGFFVSLIIYFISSFLKKMENSDNWWTKTIGRTVIKRRAILFFIFVIACSVLAIVVKPVIEVLAVVFGFIFLLLFAIVFISATMSSLVGKKHLKEISLKEGTNLIVLISFFVFIVPTISGAIAAGNLSPDRINVVFYDNKTISISDSTQLIFIGKTSNYFFIQNTLTKATTSYRMDKVKSIEVIPSKIDGVFFR